MKPYQEECLRRLQRQLEGYLVTGEQQAEELEAEGGIGAGGRQHSRVSEVVALRGVHCIVRPRKPTQEKLENSMTMLLAAKSTVMVALWCRWR